MAQITTIIPTYRRSKMLRRAIQSVLDQSFGDFEVCVYDNASEDDTREVAEEIARKDRRINYFRHPTNIGMMANFDFGISRVKSPLFNILSDDDVLLPTFFETAIGAFERHPEAAWFLGTLVIVNGDARIEHVRLPGGHEGLVPSTLVSAGLADYRTSATWTGMMFKREVLDTCGGVDVRVGPCADLDFELRVAARNPAVASKVPCAVFVDHQESSGHAKSLLILANGIPQLLANLSRMEIGEGPSRAIVRPVMKGFRKWLFNQGLLEVGRGNSGIMELVSRVLARNLEAPLRARILSAFARDPLASGVRAGFRSIRSIVRTVRARRRFDAYETAIAETLDRYGLSTDCA